MGSAYTAGLYPGRYSVKSELIGYRGRPVLFGLFLLAVCLLLTSTQALKRWDFTLYDLFSSMVQRPAAADIILIAVDEHSMAALGRWPWPRRLHAELINKLSRGGAKGIGLDILFAEPSFASPEDDVLLADAIKRNGRVVLPLGSESAQAGTSLKLTRPLPMLAQAAAGLGHVDVELDSDGLVRHAFLKAGPGRADLPAFSLEMLALDAPAVSDSGELGSGL